MDVEVYISFLLPHSPHPQAICKPRHTKRPKLSTNFLSCWRRLLAMRLVSSCSDWSILQVPCPKQFCWIKIGAYTYQEYQILVGTKWCEMRLYLNLGSSHSVTLPLTFIPVLKLIYIQFCNSLDLDSFVELWGAGLHSHLNMRQIIVVPWNTTSEKTPCSFWHTVPRGARFTVWGTTPCKANQTTTIRIHLWMVWQHFLNQLHLYNTASPLWKSLTTSCSCIKKNNSHHQPTTICSFGPPRSTNFRESCFFFSSAASFAASFSAAQEPFLSAVSSALRVSSAARATDSAFRETQWRRGSFCHARSTKRISRSLPKRLGERGHDLVLVYVLDICDNKCTCLTNKQSST